MPPQTSRASSSRAAATSRPVACQRCRRNRSFCTKDRPTCLTCRKGGHECVYSDGRKISVLASYVYELQAKIRSYEAILEAQQLDQPPVLSPLSDATSTTAATAPSHVNTQASRHEDFDFPDVEPLTEGLNNLVLSPSGNPQYLGISSSPILVRRLRDAVGITTPSNSELDHDREASVYNPEALRLRRWSTTENKRTKLPPYLTAKRYFYAQHAMIGTIFSFVSSDVFEERLQEAYNGPPSLDDIDGCLSYCQVLLLMAFGQMYALNQFTDANGPPGFAFFTEALRFLPDIHDEPSVLFCSVLALTGYFMQNLNRRDAAFLYCGLAQRMAISLAFHEEVSVPGLDDVAKEHRRRIWWTIYSLDRILCVKYGNPVTMQDDDISVALPSRLPHEPAYCGAVVLRHYTILSRILGHIMTTVYSKTRKSGSSLIAAVADIMSSLAKWEREVPAELHFDPATMTATRESISTFLHYYQCISMAVRPLLFHVVKTRLSSMSRAERSQTDWKHSLSRTTISVVETCITAARDTLSLMTAAAEKDLVAVFGYMDGEHIFSATLVLVMAYVAFPHDEAVALSMTAGLALLEDIAAKGNHHIEARHTLLIQLLAAAECTTMTVGDGQQAITTQTLGVPTASMHMSMLPVMDTDALDQLFTTSPGMGDLSMFEEAYFESDMNLEVSSTFWTTDGMV